MKCQIGCVMVAVAMATLNMGVVCGATYTWVGGDSGAFSSSSNWQDEGGQAGVPNAGDTAKFTKAVTLTAETVTLKSGTLTLDVGAKVTANVTFAGTGALAKTGAQELLMNVSSSYGGGTTISQGVIQVKKGDSLGSGLVTVDRTTAVAYLYVNAYVTVRNDIHCIGATSVSVQTTGSHLYGNGDVTFAGKITSQDCDVWIYNMWTARKYLELSGTIEIPGHTLRLVSNATNGGYKLSGTCHATIVRSQLTNGDPVLIIAADIDYPSDGTLTLNSGNLSFTADGVFGGSKVVLQGSSTGLSFARNANVRDDVEVVMGAGMTVALDASDVRIGSLKVGETTYADGRYSAETNPELVTGVGRVCVNMPILTSLWIGGATGAWYDPANWQDGQIPCDGGIAVFPDSAVTIAGDDKPIDIGETGLMVRNAKTLVFQKEITGNGRLAKYGVGVLELQKPATYKGGTLLTGGQFYYNAGDQNWANGTFVIDRGASSADTFLQVRSATHSTFPFDFEIQGPVHKDSLFYINNNTRLTGKISSNEGGFGFFNVWTGETDYMTKIDAELSAPGQAVTFSCNSATISAGYRLTKKFNASVVKNDKAPIQFEAPAVGPDETYTGTGGTNIFAKTAEWAGTNLTFTAQYGYPTALRLTHSKNLSPDATLNLKSGAVLIVDKGVSARIAHLVIDGQAWPEGKYRASTCASIAGEGSLVVGPKLGLMVIVR